MSPVMQSGAAASARKAAAAANVDPSGDGDEVVGLAAGAAALLQVGELEFVDH